MPRKYVPLKNYWRYSEEQIKAALNSIAQGLSLRAASKKHEIPVTVLHRSVKNGVRIKKHGGQTILSEEDGDCSLAVFKYVVIGATLWDV